MTVKELKSMAKGKNSPLSLHVLVEREGGKYFAHILEFDLITEGNTKAALARAIEELVEAHLDYALKHGDISNVFRPAPLEYWQKYSKGLLVSKIKPRLEEVLL